MRGRAVSCQQKTSLLRTVVVWMLSLMAGGLSYSVLCAAQSEDLPERQWLKGLSGVGVLVEPLPIELDERGEQGGLLEREIKQRLQKVGIRVLTERERLAIPPAPMLVVRVDAVHDRIGRYFFSTNLFLAQKIRLEGQDTSGVSAVTWMKLGGIGTVADDNPKHIRDLVMHKVDQFIKDFLAVNSVPGADQLPHTSVRGERTGEGQ